MSSITEEIERLQDMCAGTCELARLTIELRQAVVSYMEEHGDSSSTVAVAIDCNASEVRRFMRGAKVVIPGRYLDGLTELADCQHLRQPIIDAFARAGTPRLGLARCSSEVIRLAFELRSFLVRFGQVCSKDFLLGLFGENQELVKQASRFSHEAAECLAGAEKYLEIRALLDRPNLGEYVTMQYRQARQRASKPSATHPSVGLCAEQADSAPESTALIEPPQVPDSPPAVDEVPPTKASESESIAVAAADEPPASAATIDTEPTADSHPDEPTITPAELIREYGGTTSSLGVNFVLTPEAFRSLQGDPGALGIEWGRRQIEMTRGFLNMVTQLQDQTWQELAQEGLFDEIRELLLAIKLWAERFDPDLLEKDLHLYDDVRKTWALRRREKESTKKTTTKK